MDEPVLQAVRFIPQNVVQNRTNDCDVASLKQTTILPSQIFLRQNEMSRFKTASDEETLEANEQAAVDSMFAKASCLCDDTRKEAVAVIEQTTSDIANFEAQ